MSRKHPIFFLVTIICVPLASSLRSLSSGPCDRTVPPDPLTLRTDQMTVLINGYSESRIPILRSIAATYSASSSVSSVLVLWGNPTTPPQTLTQLSHDLAVSSASAPISIILQSSSSLNSRFLPRELINTRAVLICDDDVEVDLKSVEFAFRLWRLDPDHLVGIFARSHDFDLSKKTWIYTVHPEKYSILLTKFMIIKHEYLYKYSCEGGEELAEMRKVVDRMENCEDILMNYLVSDTIQAGPILVGMERVRDWGDARNEETRGLVEEERKRVRQVGLSSRKGDHRKTRGECIREFHRILGRMPLRYSYGKVVNSAGEQGLCDKGGRLVFCDQQIFK
ncbi:unnamed protein product [Ilex paraguariensis]|uniref:Glycosyl transferase 64 domain-containing protein n=1 Tax=Ilex paraguariensis TaxID=185542 RepID=A0ABC8RR36_9AQUA